VDGRDPFRRSKRVANDSSARATRSCGAGRGPRGGGWRFPDGARPVPGYSQRQNGAPASSACRADDPRSPHLRHPGSRPRFSGHAQRYYADFYARMDKPYDDWRPKLTPSRAADASTEPCGRIRRSCAVARVVLSQGEGNNGIRTSWSSAASPPCRGGRGRQEGGIPGGPHRACGLFRGI